MPSEQNTAKKSNLHIPFKESWLYLFTILIGVLLFTFNLSGTSLWDNDEPTYAEIAKEMMKSGNWLTPMFNHEIWFCHPPLYMWLTGGLFKLAGWSEITARAFPVFFAVAGMIMVFVFSKRFWNSKIAFLSAIILGTSLQYLVQGRMATMDSMLNTFLLLSFYCAWRGLEENGKGWWFLFFISCGLATLAKGVFGLAYPLMIFSAYLLLQGKFYRWKDVPWISGLLIYILISAPWFVYESIVYGRLFLYQVFYFYTFKRVVSPILQQAGPWYYYFPILFFGFFPWSGFLPWVFQETWKEKENKTMLFLGTWVCVTFIFFTLVNTKLPNYIFFLYPPLSMLLAFYWSRFSKKAFIMGMGLNLGILAIIAVALKWLAHQKLLPGEQINYMNNLFPILGILGIGILLGIVFELGQQRFLSFCVLLTTMISFWFTLSDVFSPITESYKPMKTMALKLNDFRSRTNAPVLAYQVHGVASLVFYSDTAITNPKEFEELLSLWKKRKNYCFVDQKNLTTMAEKMKPYWVLGHQRTLWLISNFPIPN